jgi:hypothetical protein
MKYVTLKLTKKEAVELLLVSENGLGDGEYYDSGRPGRAMESMAFDRANTKLRNALREYGESHERKYGQTEETSSSLNVDTRSGMSTGNRDGSA